MSLNFKVLASFFALAFICVILVLGTMDFEVSTVRVEKIYSPSK